MIMLSLCTCSNTSTQVLKYKRKVLKYKYSSTAICWYLSTSTQVPKKYLSTYLSTNVLKYSSTLLLRHRRLNSQVYAKPRDQLKNRLVIYLSSSDYSRALWLHVGLYHLRNQIVHESVSKESVIHADNECKQCEYWCREFAVNLAIKKTPPWFFTFGPWFSDSPSHKRPYMTHV